MTADVVSGLETKRFDERSWFGHGMTDTSASDTRLAS